MHLLFVLRLTSYMLWAMILVMDAFRWLSLEYVVHYQCVEFSCSFRFMVTISVSTSVDKPTTVML